MAKRRRYTAPSTDDVPRFYVAFLDQTAIYSRCFKTLEDIVRYALQVVRPHQMDAFIAYLETLEREKVSERRLLHRWQKHHGYQYYVIPEAKVILALALRIARKEGPDGTIYLRPPVPRGDPWTNWPYVRE